MADLPTTLLVKPRQDIPVGRTSGGEPVYWDTSFAQSFLKALYQRVGQMTAPSNDTIAARVDSVTDDVSGLEDDVATLAADVTTLQTSQAAQDTHLATIDSEISALQHEVIQPYIALGVTGSLAADLTQGGNFLVGPMTGNVTIANPLGGEDGKTYTWLVKQDATGGRTVGLDTKFVKGYLSRFAMKPNAITQMQAIYNAADDKFYIAPLQILAQDEWQTLTGTTGAIATDLSICRNAFVGPITGNVTISNPTNPADGEEYTWYITQDGTGGRTIGLGAKFAKSALTFVPDTTASTSTIFSARYSAVNDKYYVFAFQTKVS
jgi:hypothetical protein